MRFVLPFTLGFLVPFEGDVDVDILYVELLVDFVVELIVLQRHRSHVETLFVLAHLVFAF